MEVCLSFYLPRVYMIYSIFNLSKLFSKKNKRWMELRSQDLKTIVLTLVSHSTSVHDLLSSPTLNLIFSCNIFWYMGHNLQNSPHQIFNFHLKYFWAKCAFKIKKKIIFIISNTYPPLICEKMLTNALYHLLRKAVCI